MNTQSYGSGLWDDARFAAEVEACSYPGEQFKHGDHIRLAWIYLRRYGAEAAAARVTTTIRQFARGLGQEQKYHETMTRAWLRLVEAAHRATPEESSFDEFLAKHPWLLDRRALNPFYTAECLSSDLARQHAVEPDRRPLP
jgi:hypothetical protein